MSILMIDSFDGYVESEATNYWVNEALFGIGIGPPARTGVNAIQPSAGGVARSIGDTLLHAIIGAAWLSNVPSGVVFAFGQGLGFEPYQCQLLVLQNGTVAIRQGSNGPIVATSDPSTTLVQAGIYNYIEWYASFTSGGGLNQVYVNGQLVLSSVCNTQGLSTPGANSVFLLGLGGGSASFFDDFYLVNPDDGTGLTTFAGDSSVICSISSANGDVNEWTPFPATNQNWQNVHEIPSSNGALYNRSGGVNTADDYQVSPLLAVTDKILAVQLTHVTFAEETADIAEPFLSIQGTHFNDNAHVYEPTTAGYSPVPFIYERNPLPPNNPWTGPAFNGTYWGIGQIDHPVTFSVRMSAVHSTNRGAVSGVID